MSFDSFCTGTKEILEQIQTTERQATAPAGHVTKAIWLFFCTSPSSITLLLTVESNKLLHNYQRSKWWLCASQENVCFYLWPEPLGP